MLRTRLRLSRPNHSCLNLAAGGRWTRVTMLPWPLYLTAGIASSLRASWKERKSRSIPTRKHVIWLARQELRRRRNSSHLRMARCRCVLSCRRCMNRAGSRPRRAMWPFRSVSRRAEVWLAQTGQCAAACRLRRGWSTKTQAWSWWHLMANKSTWPLHPWPRGLMAASSGCGLISTQASQAMGMSFTCSRAPGNLAGTGRFLLAWATTARRLKGWISNWGQADCLAC